MMKALLSHQPGGPETLKVTDLPDPVPGPGELLVRVNAAAINYPDVLIIEDKYQFKPPRPFAPGGEIAGVVEAVGDGVDGWSIGDRLIAVPGWGGLAEKVVIMASSAFRLPAHRSFEDGAALLLTYATSIHALYDRGQLQTGQTLLVLGAAGGVGTAAITRAPRALPSSTAARPTPPAAPSTSNVCPLASFPRSYNAWIEVA
jgi:NADPH:quinone reductase-like Zn-dependent oxidoreductase